MTDSTQRFTGRAVDYAAHRPGYSTEVIDAVLAELGDPNGLVAADVGAGTGISANALAQRGVRVIAIEPNAAMRTAAQPNALVEWRTGTGDATGLPDKSVDLVGAFQAFHWFANVESMRELARIARRRVVLVQSERDETDSPTQELAGLYRRYSLDDTELRRLRALEIFAGFPGAAVHHQRFAWERTFDLETLLGMASSASYLPKAGPTADALRGELAAFFEKRARDGALPIRMQTFVLRAHL